MKLRAIVVGLGLLACLAAIPASAQITANTLPGSYTSAMVTGFAYTPAPALSPDPSSSYVANVGYYVDFSGGDYYYFYKVTHVSGSPIRAASLNVAPSVLNQQAGLFLFGSFKPNSVDNILVADNILGPNIKPLRWSEHPTHPGLSGDTVYLWAVSKYPSVPVNLGILDGIASNTTVPAPAPEPMSMALAGLGLGAVAAVRRKLSR